MQPHSGFCDNAAFPCLDWLRFRSPRVASSVFCSSTKAHSGILKVCTGVQGVRKDVTEQMKGMRGSLMREVWDLTGRAFTKEDFESLESSIVMV